MEVSHGVAASKDSTPRRSARDVLGALLGLRNPHVDPSALGETAVAGPGHVWIEPTNRCNIACRHCGHYYHKFGRDMPWELFEKIRDSVLDGVQRAELIGYGEPLMAEHFDEIFQECVRRGIAVYTTTNGLLLRTDEDVLRFVRNGVRLVLSIDGARRETLEFVRPKVRWEKMIEILERIKRCAGDPAAAKEFSLRLNFVPMKQNIADLPDLVRLAARYGAEQIYCLPLSGEDVHKEMAGQSLHNSPELVSPAYVEALGLSDKLGVSLHVPPSFGNLILEGRKVESGWRGRVRRLARGLRRGRSWLRRNGLGAAIRRLIWGSSPKSKTGGEVCVLPWGDTFFAADGKVYPCCVLGEELGDLRTEKWSEIWNGRPYRNLRRLIHSWNPSKVCRGCSLPSGINGGDERRHEKLFAKFRCEGFALDSSDLDFGRGFHALERDEQGAPTHLWMERRGVFSLPAGRDARFLRLEIIPRSPPLFGLNSGRCRINGAEAEPFDNTCPEVVFPLTRAGNGRLEVVIEMDEVFEVQDDPRELGLAIRGAQLLS